MKKIIAFALCLVMVLAMAVPTLAAEPEIGVAGIFEVGGTAFVDHTATMDSVYNYGTSELYNALYEGAVIYSWYRDNAYYKSGEIITFVEEDAGCSFYCEAVFYSDLDFSEQVGVLYSDTFAVEELVTESMETIGMIDATLSLDSVVIAPGEFEIIYATIPEDAYEGVIVMRPELESVMVPEASVAVGTAAMPAWLGLVIVILLCILIGLVALAIPILLIILIVTLVRGKKKKAPAQATQTMETVEEIQENQE